MGQDGADDKPGEEDRETALRRLLEDEVWPLLPQLGRAPSREEQEEILGYGRDGV
jgi:hypothetical protein